MAQIFEANTPVIGVGGKPGAGKGTRLSKFLKERPGEYIDFSVGTLLREDVKNSTDLGKEAKKYMDAGELVPDELIMRIVSKAVSEADKPVIIDGFPRTVAQAIAAINSGMNLVKYVEVYVPDEVVVQRAADRLCCKQCGETFTKQSTFKRPKVEGVCDKCGGELGIRSDDEPSVVLKRLKTYDDETAPVVKVLEEADVPVVRVNGDGDNNPNVDEDFARAMSV